MSDKPLKKCPDCAGPLEKLISRSSFQLKGTGWYVTDYGRKSSAGKSDGSSSKEPSSPSSKDSSSSSSKDAASSASSDSPPSSQESAPAKKSKSSETKSD